MELQELKELWQAYDAKLEKSVKLNVAVLQEMKLARTRSLTYRMGVFTVGELIIDFLAVVWLGSFMADQIHSVKFVIPALVLFGAALLSIASGIYRVVLLGQIDYSGPVAAVQEKLSLFQAEKLRATKWILLSATLIWTPLLIVVMKAFLDVDMYAVPGYLLANVVTGVVVLVAGLLLSKKLVNRIGHPGFVQALMDDISGRSLNAAIVSLQKVREFEKES